MNCHKNSHIGRNKSLLSISITIFYTAFILVLAGCSDPAEPKSTEGTIQTPAASDYNISGLEQIYDGYAKYVTITPNAGKSNGSITVYYNGSTNAPYNVGSYTVTFDVAAADGWNAVNGLSAGTMTITALSVSSSITELTANVWVDGNIAKSGGEQWFKFTATADIQYIHFNPGTLNNVHVQLYDTGYTIVGNKTNLFSGVLYTFRTLTAGNEYYIKVTPPDYSNYIGEYKIMFNESFIPPDTTITAISGDTWADGNIDTANKEQWFEFTASVNTQCIHFQPGTLSSVYVQLYNSTGTTVMNQIYLSASAAYYSVTITNDNVYYIKVEPVNSGLSGTYKIMFNESFILPDTNITTLNADTWTDGYIDTANGEQWFKFTATANTQYIHFAPGTLGDVNIQVYNSTGTTVGGQTWLYRAALYTTRMLTSGNECYIRITPYFNYNGAYKIAFNESFIPPDTAVTVISDNTWTDGNIDYTNEKQWFKFTATAASQNIHFEPGTLGDVNIQLYNNAGGTVGTQTWLYSDVLYTTRTLTAGNEYYIRVTPYLSNNVGEYKIAFNGSFIPPNTTVPTLKVNTWEDGNIDSLGGTQWFKFTATANTRYIHFESGTLDNVYIQLYRQLSDTSVEIAGNQIYLSDVAHYNSLTITNGNVYYIKVTTFNNEWSGTYKIMLNMSSISSISVLSADTWADGYISDYTNKEQWFNFTATANTQYIHFQSGNLTNAYIQVYDTNGTAIQSQTNLNDAIRYTSRTLTIGNEYYIRVTPFSNSSSGGTYKILFNVFPVSSNTNVITLSANTWGYGEIASIIGEQWFKFTATADTQYLHFQPGTLNSVYVQLYDTAFAVVGSQTNLSGSALYTTRTLTSGNEYYIKVTPYNYSTGMFGIGFTLWVILPETSIYTLTVNRWEYGSITSSSTVKEEWFKFTATATTQYIHYNTSDSSDVYIQLYDCATGATVGTRTAINIDSVYYTTYITRTLTVGKEYYIKVTPYFSDHAYYRIGLTNWEILPGTVIRPMGTDQWCNGNFANGSEEWFIYSATANALYLHLNPKTLGSSYAVQLYDSATYAAVGSQISLFGSTSYASLALTVGKDYYIKVTSSNGGEFSLGFTTSTTPPQHW